MNKPKTNSDWLRPRYLLILTLVCALVCLFSLRANNEHMLSLRDAVYAADKNDGNVTGALQHLQDYVTRHMNTSLDTGSSVYPPIQLKYTYDRLLQAQGAALQQQNGQLYTEAQAYCEKQDPTDFSGRNRVPCIEQYVQQHGLNVSSIPDSLYKFDFVSPRWSPDLAGWSLVATLLALVATIVSLTARLLRKNSRK